MADLIAKARKVLGSGNPVARDALARNITYFAHAVEMEDRLSRVEEQLNTLGKVVNVAAAKRIRANDPPGHEDELFKMRVIASVLKPDGTLKPNGARE